MKKYSLFILLTALIGFSSCATLRIDKRHYSGGWYVDFGNNAKPQTSVDHNNEETTTIAVQEVPVEEAAYAGTAPAGSECKNCEQNSDAGKAGETVVVSPSATEEPIVNNSSAEQKQTPVAQEKTKSAAASSSQPADAPFWALFLLALFLPPLAVFLKQGVTTLFWIDLILALVGGGFFFSTYLGGAFLVAVIIAMLVIFDVI